MKALAEVYVHLACTAAAVTVAGDDLDLGHGKLGILIHKEVALTGLLVLGMMALTEAV